MEVIQVPCFVDNCSLDVRGIAAELHGRCLRLLVHTLNQDHHGL